MIYAEIWEAYKKLTPAQQKVVRLREDEILAVRWSLSLEDKQNLYDAGEILRSHFDLTRLQAIDILHEIGCWLARQK